MAHERASILLLTEATMTEKPEPKRAESLAHDTES